MTLESKLDDLVSNPRFLELLEQRAETEYRYKESHKLFSELNEKLNSSLVGFSSEDFTDEDAKGLRQAARDAREAIIANKDVKAELEELKNEIAAVAHDLGEQRMAELAATGQMVSYTKDTVGESLVFEGEYETGSREWLEARQNGVGGSDVGQILGADKEHSAENKKQVFASKVEPISDEQVFSQSTGQTVFTDAASRGNAWESLIGCKFAENHPEFKVFHTKATWVSKEDPVHKVNFDFLYSSDGSDEPDSILEIKTSSKPEDWGSDLNSIDSIPEQYKYQIWWYALASGFRNVTLAVVIDETEYREYSFKVSETQIEIMQDLKETKILPWWGQVQETIKTGVYPSVSRRIPKGIAKAILQRGSMDLVNYEQAKSLHKIACISGIEYKHMLNLMFRWFNEHDLKPLEVTLYEAMLANTFKDMGKTVIGVDLETSSPFCLRGSVIELGVSVRDFNGKVEREFSELFNIPDNQVNAWSTEAEAIHNISRDMIAGKRTFEDPEVQRQVMEMFTHPNAVFVAHNMHFEKSWFRAWLEGFAEAEARGDIVFIDTMDLVKWTEWDAPTNKLESFCEANGVKYEKAHRSLQDVNMMLEALFNWDKKRMNILKDVCTEPSIMTLAVKQRNSKK